MSTHKDAEIWVVNQLCFRPFLITNTSRTTDLLSPFDKPCLLKACSSVHTRSYKKNEQVQRVKEEHEEESSQLLSNNLFDKVEHLQLCTSSKMGDRFTSQCKIGSKTFKYSRYDSGRVDSAEDGIFINVKQCADAGSTIVFSYVDNFVETGLSWNLEKACAWLRNSWVWVSLVTHCLLKAYSEHWALEKVTCKE